MAPAPVVARGVCLTVSYVPLFVNWNVCDKGPTGLFCAG